MAKRLSDIQAEFTLDVASLIRWCFANGYKVTLGEAHRTPEQQRIHVQRGRSRTMRSAHLIRLAIDLNLFKDGRYLTRSEDYTSAGEYWKSLHPKNVWGGDFPKDGNHFQRNR